MRAVEAKLTANLGVNLGPVVTQSCHLRTRGTVDADVLPGGARSTTDERHRRRNRRDGRQPRVRHARHLRTLIGAVDKIAHEAPTLTGALTAA
jgi:hypothetical protein